MSLLNIAFASLGRAAALGRMVLTVYVVHLLLALPLTLAFRRLLEETTRNSMEYDILLEGFQYTVLSEFLRAHGPAIAGLMHGGLVLALVAVPVNTFLSGGILTVLVKREQPFSMRTFFRGCGEEFLRFAGVLAFTGLSLMAVGGLLALGMGLVVGVLSSSAETEIPVIIAAAFGIVVFLLGILGVILMGDYARIVLVDQKDRTIVDAIWRSARFVLGNIAASYGLAVLYALAAALLFSLLTLAWSNLGMASTASLVVTVVLQQGFVVLRGWLRVGSYDGAIMLYRSRAPEQGLRPSTLQVLPGGDTSGTSWPRQGGNPT